MVMLKVSLKSAHILSLYPFCVNPITENSISLSVQFLCVHQHSVCVHHCLGVIFLYSAIFPVRSKFVLISTFTNNFGVVCKMNNSAIRS